MKPVTLAIALLALCPSFYSEAAPASASASSRATSAPAGDILRPRVNIQTSLGDIVVELDARKAPISVDNFLQYAEEGFYNGTIFHRVMSDFMIQGGSFTPDQKDKPGSRPPIVNEWQNGLKNERGAIAMARLPGKPNSATNGFFINVVDNPNLDMPQPDGAGFAVFGRVVEGMDVVEKIRFAKVIDDPHSPFHGQAITPAEAIEILSVKALGGVTRKMLAPVLEAERQTAAKAKASAVKNAADAAKRGNQEADNQFELVVKKSADELHASAERDASGIVTFVISQGQGAVVSPNATVSLHYRGTLPDGTEFDNSYKRGKPFSVSLDRPQTIEGFWRAAAKMKVGEKRRVIIPSRLGYGPQAVGDPSKGGIPANSTLIFDLELVSAK